MADVGSNLYDSDISNLIRVLIMVQDWVKEEEEEGEDNLDERQVDKKWLKKIWRMSRSFVEYVIE